MSRQQQPNVIKYNKLNKGDLTISAPKKNALGKYAAYLNIINIKDKFYFELEYLVTPYGVSAYNPGDAIAKDALSYTLSLQKRGGNNASEEDVEKLFSLLQSIDEKMIDYGVEHSQIIYGKEKSKTIVEAFYESSRLVKKSVGKDGTAYPDKFDLKFERNADKTPDVLIYTNSSTPIQPESFDEIVKLIPKGTVVKAIVQPRIYFIPGGKYGIKFIIVQLKIPGNTQKYGKPVTYAFSDPIEESSNNDSVVKKIELVDDEKTKTSSNEVSNDEAYDSEVEVGDEDV